MSGARRIQWSDIMRIRDFKMIFPGRGTGCPEKDESLSLREGGPALLPSVDSLSNGRGDRQK
jgi:hypothetical protein